MLLGVVLGRLLAPHHYQQAYLATAVPPAAAAAASTIAQLRAATAETAVLAGHAALLVSAPRELLLPFSSQKAAVQPSVQRLGVAPLAASAAPVFLAFAHKPALSAARRSAGTTWLAALYAQIAVSAASQMHLLVGLQGFAAASVADADHCSDGQLQPFASAAPCSWWQPCAAALLRP